LEEETKVERTRNPGAFVSCLLETFTAVFHS